jgi:hypothetical protein
MKKEKYDAEYEEEQRNQFNLLRKVRYGHSGYKGGNEPSPSGENAVRAYEDNN